MDQKLAISELERLAFEACEASKRAETFEQRYQAALVFAQCEIALHLAHITAPSLEDAPIQERVFALETQMGIQVSRIDDIENKIDWSR